MIDDTPGGQSKLNTLKAPLVRVHAGDDGGRQAIPQIKTNQWSNTGESRPFENLDNLVDAVFASGQQPVMNIKFAPDFMWSCYPNSIGANANQTQGVGQIKDLTFQQYAQYMARLVSYYNKGSMVTEQGVTITNPAGTSHKITWWEPWNEPDLNNETPCAPNSGNGLTPQQFLTMWNAAVPAMKAVDSSIKLVGPATAGSQFGSSTNTGNQYVDLLMANSTVKPDAISFHSYGYWDNTVTDKWILDGDNTEPASECCGGVTDFVHGINSIRSKYPTTPIWLTEVNVNADWGADTRKRPWSEFAAAWWGSLFAKTAPLGAELIHHYNVVEGPQFGLFDDQTGNAFMSYYVIMLLNKTFPQGSTILSSSSTVGDVLSLAVRKPNGDIGIMVVNRQLVSNTVKSGCGVGGVPVTVTVNLSGLNASSGSLEQLDKTNINCTSNAAIAPAVQTINPTQPLTITFPGYGLAVLNITASVSVSPAPTITPSPSAPISAPVSPSPVSSPSPVKAGDIDGNGKVDIFDYNILLTNFGKTGTGIQGDVNNSGKVDIFDYNILLTNFGK
jgi:hypothetical protein